MNWWVTLLPAAAIAIGVRILAIFGPKYYSWLELFSWMNEEDARDVSLRRRTLSARLAVLYAIAGVATFTLPNVNQPEDGAIIGALGAGLLLWPMVFHGLPWGIYRWTWVLILAYGSLVALFAIAGGVGCYTALLLTGRTTASNALVENLAYSLLTATIAAVIWFIYEWSFHKLGKLATASNSIGKK